MTLRAALRLVAVAALLVQLLAIQREPSALAILLGVLLLAGAVAVEVDHRLVAGLWTRRTRWAVANAQNLEFLTAELEMPNRNHVLFELRVAMPEARASGRPFVLTEISLPSPDAEPAVPPALRRTLEQKLVETLKALTRQTDLLAELSDGSYCVVLLDCTAVQSARFIRRLPETVSGSHEGVAWTARVAVRLLEYDLQSVYSTDVLDELARQPQYQRRPADAAQRRRASRRAFARPVAVRDRALLEQFLRDQYRIAVRHRLPLSVGVITVTGLAEVRAAHGEPLSRRALRHVAALAEQATRDADLVASLGPDRLAVVFPGLGREKAGSSLDVLVARTATTPLFIDGAGPLTLTLRVGVAELDAAEATSPEQLLARAQGAADGDLHVPESSGSGVELLRRAG